MKDFVKWLGVNDKVAKVVVWLFIIIIMLVLINLALDSIGLPHYQITYQNLKQVNSTKAIRIISSTLVCILNFYCMILLVFRLKEAKPIFKYAVLYTALNWLITELFNYAIVQAFIIIFVLVFCYFYSKKKIKYILYGILSICINMAIQGIAYMYKIHYVDFASMNAITVALLSIDYFIIMGVIILVKEIYLKKRSEKVCGMDQEAYCGSVNSKKKVNSPKKSQKK